MNFALLEDMMTVLIVIPPYTLDTLGNGVIPIKAMLPVGPLSIATALLEKGCDVHVVDLTFSLDWRSVLSGSPIPDLLLVSCHTARNIGIVRTLLTFLDGEWGTLPHTVLGGNVCVELGTEEFLKLQVPVQAVIRGYGHAPRTIEALIRKVSGDVVGPPEPILPIPAIQLLNTAIHAQYLSMSEGKYPMVGHGFGCLWDCVYCVAKMDTKWTPRDTVGIAQEVQIAHSLGYGHIWCVDNLLMANPEATLRFDTLIEAQDMDWSGMTRPELIVKNENHLGKSRRLTNVAMGVESASGKQLEEYNRKASVPPRDAFRLLAEYAPKVGRTAFAMLDWPGSTEDDFRLLYLVLEDCNPTAVSWSFFNPPADELLKGRNPEEYGFYRWPFGLSAVQPERAVQHAMIFMGRWSCGWAPEENPYFTDGERFGVHFQEARVYQQVGDRSPTGDIWKSWKQQRKRR